LVRAVDGIEPANALDLACGTGRNALYLASLGWRVTAVDRSAVAIELLQQHARERGVTVDTRIADLEAGEFLWAGNAYRLICDCNYLQRDLFPRIRNAVQPGGLIVAMIQMVDDAPDVAPMNPAYLIQPGELRAEFSGWEILHDVESRPLEDPKRRLVAELIARKPAATG
jgi:tellurite methyltransferase